MGKSFGIKLKSSLISTSIAPGPGQYSGDKCKSKDVKYSMGAKISPLRNATEVPGPGAYNRMSLESIKSMKFGTG